MIYLVADIDENDFGGRIERNDVGVDPLKSDVEIGGERWEIAVSNSDDDFDAGAGQRFDDGGISAV